MLSYIMFHIGYKSKFMLQVVIIIFCISLLKAYIKLTNIFFFFCILYLKFENNFLKGAINLSDGLSPLCYM